MVMNFSMAVVAPCLSEVRALANISFCAYINKTNIVKKKKKKNKDKDKKILIYECHKQIWKKHDMNRIRIKYKVSNTAQNSHNSR